MAFAKGETAMFNDIKLGIIRHKGSVWAAYVGNRKLDDLSATISGGNSGDFSIKSPIRKSLAPGQSAKVQITFKPQNSGRRSSALFIRSTDGDESFFRIVISGVGITELK